LPNCETWSAADSDKITNSKHGLLIHVLSYAGVTSAWFSCKLEKTGAQP
jgi:hypothetical protein